MSEKHINLRLGSTADTSGFTQMGKAVDTFGKNVQKASNGLAGVTGALGQMNGVVGKVAGGLSSLFSSFAGGPIGVAIASITLIVSLLSKWKNHMDDTKKKWEEHHELMKKMSEGYERRLQRAIEGARKKQEEFLDSMIKKGQTAIDKLEKLRSRMKELGKSHGDLQDAGFDERISQIRKDAQAKSSGETKDVAAITMADAKVEELKVKEEQLLSQYARSLYENTAETDKVNSQLKELGKIRNIQIKKGEDLTATDEKIQDAMNRLKILENERATVTKKHNTAMSDHSAEVLKATNEAKQARKTEHDNRVKGETVEKNKQTLSGMKDELKKTENNERDKKEQLEKIKDQLKKLNDTEKDLKDKIESANKERHDNAQNNLTGDDRKRARNEAREKANQEKRTQRRLKAEENKMQRLNAQYKWNRNALTDKQKEQLFKWRKDQTDKRKLNNVRKSKKELEKEAAQLEKDVKEMPSNIRVMKEKIEDFCKRNEVA